uniref:Uncharacterized protein n=1 Tax=Rangifer tarandus platyrhynchus TaxID=3082113 RepID=A0ACB0DQ72_RANTA|nr:unnamed protein product [Rangifer tarandus platyrhynchus]
MLPPPQAPYQGRDLDETLAHVFPDGKPEAGETGACLRKSWGSSSPAEALHTTTALPRSGHYRQRARVRRRDEDAKVSGAFRLRSEGESRN